MERRRVPYAKFSLRSLFHGQEIPISKDIPPSQVHHDYFPVRSAGRVLATVSTSPVPAYYSQEKTQWTALPAQLLASASFPHVPVLKTVDFVGKRSDAVQVARTGQAPKVPVFRAEQRSRTQNFNPYTLQDYQRLKPAFSHALGGLGPVRVGTEQWTLGVRKLQRIRKFAEGLRRSHTIGP